MGLRMSGTSTDTAKVELVIESGIPIPPQKRNLSGVAKALLALKKGQSVFIPNKTPPGLAGYVQTYKLAGKLTMRTVEGGCRVWRIK
jgi:uncharacterized protein (DUF2249 family)